MALRPQRQAEPIRKRLERLGVDPSIDGEPQTPAARAIECTQTEIAAESARPAKRAKHGMRNTARVETMEAWYAYDACDMVSVPVLDGGRAARRVCSDFPPKKRRVYYPQRELFFV